MRKLFLIFSFIFCIHSFSQEAFLVLQVEGSITYDSITKPIQVGDEFFGNPKFKFATDKAKAVILSNLKGRVVLFPNKPEQETTSALVYYLKNNILPVKEYTATRGDNSDAIQLIFKNNALYHTKTIKVYKRPKDQNSYYFLSYKRNAIEFISKLDMSSNGFIEISKATFETPPDSTSIHVPEHMKLHYYNAETTETIHLKNLKFDLIQLESIESELKLYQQWLVQQGVKRKKHEALLTDYIQDTYTSDLNLNDFTID
ncbi:hypothetical protein [Psychroserpens sp. MEBiC05023]